MTTWSRPTYRTMRIKLRLVRALASLAHEEGGGDGSGRIQDRRDNHSEGLQCGRISEQYGHGAASQGPGSTVPRIKGTASNPRGHAARRDIS